MEVNTHVADCRTDGQKPKTGRNFNFEKNKHFLDLTPPPGPSLR